MLLVIRLGTKDLALARAAVKGLPQKTALFAPHVPSRRKFNIIHLAASCLVQSLYFEIEPSSLTHISRTSPQLTFLFTLRSRFAQPSITTEKLSSPATFTLIYS